MSLLFGSGGDHCDLALAVVMRSGEAKEKEKKEQSRDDIKSSNPDLTGKT